MTSSKRRLLIRPGGIGDTILTFPALEFLCAGFTEVWVRREIVPLVRFAGRVRAIADTGLDQVVPPPALIEELRKFDDIVSWHGARRLEFRAEVARLGLPFRFLDALPAPGSSRHAADFFMTQAGGPLPAIPRIDCRGVPNAAAIFHPFSGGGKKNWPLERFHELAARLEMPVVWCAGPEEKLAGALRMDDLYELACRLAGASVYVGNDSGITHLAAAAGARVVALFGSSDPAVWAPRGERVRVISATAVDQIEVGDVLSAVKLFRS